MLHDRFRTHTLTHLRPGRTSDGAGGYTATTSEVGTIIGSLQPVAPTEQVTADQERALVRWVLFCDPAEDLRRDDLVHDPTPDRTLRVIGTLVWHAGGGLDHLRVELEEIQRGQ